MDGRIPLVFLSIIDEKSRKERIISLNSFLNREDLIFLTILSKIRKFQSVVKKAGKLYLRLNRRFELRHKRQKFKKKG